MQKNIPGLNYPSQFLSLRPQDIFDLPPQSFAQQHPTLLQIKLFLCWVSIFLFFCHGLLLGLEENTSIRISNNLNLLNLMKLNYRSLGHDEGFVTRGVEQIPLK
ncbi:hypothetical protein TNCT_237071 [Trichonephila clavata]|uniref:Uncharacterized protein n=1 Tax=Trichonephila clavata TaxID=2740835 RepID=A0A8X6FBJ2_TRICU|nr:hypothetical protein TNCT_237071 [Trichonephila clavata]